MSSDSIDDNQQQQSTFNYDTGFLCTYHLMNEPEPDVNDSDSECDYGNMSENLYRIQLSQALRMNMDISRVIAGDRDGYDHHAMEQFIDFISDKTKPYYDERYKAVLRKHPCLTFKCDEPAYDTEAVNANANANANANDNDNDNGDDDDDVDMLINGVVPMLISYDSFHAFHRCMIDVFSLPNAMGLISDESLRLLESTYEQISQSMRAARSMDESFVG
jgi:hypothetical protein